MSEFERFKALARKYLEEGKPSGTTIIELIAIGLQVEERCREHYNKTREE
jgi:hypothetical protein